MIVKHEKRMLKLEKHKISKLKKITLLRYPATSMESKHSLANKEEIIVFYYSLNEPKPWQQLHKEKGE